MSEDITPAREWVTNTPAIPSHDEVRAFHDGDWDAYWTWRNQFREGSPKPSATYSAEQLEGMGMIGLYRASEA